MDEHAEPRVLIVGAGAAGLFCAALLAEHPPGKVLLLEAQDRPGRKLRATGNGRCNLSNRFLGPGDYDHAPEFLGRLFVAVPPKLIHQTFERWGLPLVERERGRLFPQSEAASSVLAVLLHRIEAAGFELRTGTRVLDLQRRPGRGYSVRCSDGSQLGCERLVLAMGSPSYAPVRGGSEGFSLLSRWGYRLVPLRPALVPLTTHERWPEALVGLKRLGRVSLLLRGRPLATCEGDVLFTSYGLSGNAVLDLSLHVSGEPGEELELSLLPEVPEASFETALRRSPYPLGIFLALYLPEPQAKAWCMLLGFDPLRPSRTLQPREISTLLASLYRQRLRCTGTRGLAEAQVSRGGVALEQVDPTTLESSLHPGCHLLGDCLDLCGRSGGFNLHLAWSTALLAARTIVTDLNGTGSPASPERPLPRGPRRRDSRPRGNG